MIGTSLLICLFCLSLVRLEISLRPFSFMSQNHALLSYLLVLLILGSPVVQMGVWLLLEGHACDKDAKLLALGLYQQDLWPPGLIGHRVSEPNYQGWTIALSLF